MGFTVGVGAAVGVAVGFTVGVGTGSQPNITLSTVIIAALSPAIKCICPRPM